MIRINNCNYKTIVTEKEIKLSKKQGNAVSREPEPLTGWKSSPARSPHGPEVLTGRNPSRAGTSRGPEAFTEPEALTLEINNRFFRFAASKCRKLQSVSKKNTFAAYLLKIDSYLRTHPLSRVSKKNRFRIYFLSIALKMRAYLNIRI